LNTFWLYGIVLFWLICGPCSAASTKAEDDLRTRLAYTQAQLVLALKESAAAKLALAATIARTNAAAVTPNSTSQQVIAAAADQAHLDAGLTSSATEATANANASLALTAQQIQTELLVRASENNQWATYAVLITQAFGFLTLIAGFIWKFISDGRAHAWSLNKIAEVKDSADAAYKEANTVNMKIAAVGLKMADGSQLAPDHSVKL
jgi:hypothetical protein